MRSPEAETEWFQEHGVNFRDEALVRGLADNLPYWQIGEQAGYSAGSTTDATAKRNSWSAAVSRAKNREGIQLLLAEFLVYREHGSEDLATPEEVLKALTQLSRTATGQARFMALKYLDERHLRMSPDRFHQTPGELAARLLNEFGEKRTRVLLKTVGLDPDEWLPTAIVEAQREHPSDRLLELSP